MDVVLAHMRLDQQPRRRTGGRQTADCSRRAEGEVTHTVDVDDGAIGVYLLDDAGELGDHGRSPRNRRAAACCAWQIATASASAASGLVLSQLDNNRPTINCTCDFSACPAPTTAFLTRLAEYSATG